MTRSNLMLSALLLAGLATTAQAAPADQNNGASDTKLKITHAGDRATRTDLGQYFTGDTLVNPLFQNEDNSHTTAASVTFEPGARTNWHTHPVGQQLVVTDGVGWVQKEGQPRQQIQAGDVVWIPAGVKHWHGAAADHSMTHLAIQERRDGQNVKWLGPVNDAQYNGETTDAGTDKTAKEDDG